MARDYAKFSPRFWIGETGRRFRHNRSAQVLAAYLITAPGSSMTGIYYLPLPVVAHETGMTAEEVIAALAFLTSIDFAHYDDVHELVWVPSMAGWQIDDELKPGDKRVIGVKRELEPLRGHRFVVQFWARYGVAFNLGTLVVQGSPTPIQGPSQGPYQGPYQGPSNLLRSQDQDQDQDQEQISPPAGAPAHDPSEQSTEHIHQAPGLTGPSLAKLFGRIRCEVTGAGIEWQGTPTSPEKASNMAAAIETMGAAADVEVTIREFWRRAKAGTLPKAHEVVKSPSFAFGCWCSAFPELLEALRGKAPRAPPDPGAPRCAFHRLTGTNGKRARSQDPTCVECRHVTAGAGRREAEPSAPPLPTFKPPAAWTPEQLAEYESLTKRKGTGNEAATEA